DSFTYTVSDGQGGSDTATVTIDVLGGNAPPDAVDDDLMSDQFGGSADLLTNDTDPEADPLTITAVNGDPGAVSTEEEFIFIDLESGAQLIVFSSGSASYDTRDVFNALGEGEQAEDSFTYTVSDGQGGSDTATVTVIITGENDRVQPVDDLAITTINTPIDIDVLANDIDPDGDPISLVRISTEPSNGTAEIDTKGTDDPTDDTVIYTPDPDFFGQDFFRYRASDPSGRERTGFVNVAVQTLENTAPTAVDDDLSIDGALPLDQQVFLDVSFLVENDIDPDNDLLFITELTAPANGTLEIVDFNETPDNPADDTLVYTPGTPGLDSFSYTLSDGRGGTDTATVTLLIDTPNTAPVAVDDAFVTDEDTPLIFSLVDNDSDPEGDDLEADPPSTLANGRISDNGDGTFTFTPFEDANGTDSDNYRLSDGRGGIDFATLTITVNPVNDAPLPGEDLAFTDPGTPVTIDVLANDTDVEGDALELVSVADGGSGTTVIEADGTVTYTPGEGFSGSDTFTYEVSDGNGGISTGTVEVRETPDPVTVRFSVDTNQVFWEEETLVTFDFEVVGDLPEGGVALWFYADQPGASFVSAPSLFPDLVDNDILPQAINQYALANRILTNVEQSDITALTGLRPFPDFTVFQALITDQTGSISFPAFPAQLGLFNVEGESPFLPSPYTTVWKVVDAPIVVDDLSPTSSGGRPDPVFNDVEFVGSPEITVYQNRDQLPDEANSAPTGTDEAYTVAPGETLSVSAAEGVLADESDADGDPLTAYILENPRNGTLTLNDDGSFDYTPGDGFEGEDSFTYLVRDDGFGSTVATATIAVGGGANTPPEAVDDGATTALGTPVEIAVLANDSDPDGQTLGIASFSQGANGTVALDGDALVFTPNDGFSGVDSFIYTVTDGAGGEATAEVTVAVSGTDDGFAAVFGDDGGRGDNLTGSDASEVFVSGAGSFDRTAGGIGADIFVFGDETRNGRRDLDIIRDYEPGFDAIGLIDGAAVATVREASSGLLVYFEGDGDLLQVLGAGLTADDLDFVTDPFLV
ncbi:MAG: Ig-like domain-containing protein, partial [Pseudomonadota bacterium]